MHAPYSGTLQHYCYPQVLILVVFSNHLVTVALKPTISSPNGVIGVSFIGHGTVHIHNKYAPASGRQIIYSGKPPQSHFAIAMHCPLMGTVILQLCTLRATSFQRRTGKETTPQSCGRGRSPRCNPIPSNVVSELLGKPVSIGFFDDLHALLCHTILGWHHTLSKAVCNMVRTQECGNHKQDVD